MLCRNCAINIMKRQRLTPKNNTNIINFWMVKYSSFETEPEIVKSNEAAEIREKKNNFKREKWNENR